MSLNFQPSTRHYIPEDRTLLLELVKQLLGGRIIGFVNWPNPSRRTMALGSTQPLTEMSTRNLPGGKGSRRVRLTTWLPSVSQFSNLAHTTPRLPRAGYCQNMHLEGSSSCPHFLHEALSDRPITCRVHSSQRTAKTQQPCYSRFGKTWAMTLRYAVASAQGQRMDGWVEFSFSSAVTELTSCVDFHFINNTPFIIRP
jgi:hypothetical protein